MRRRNFRRDLGARQHAAVAWLDALAEFEFVHLDLRVQRIGFEPLFAETPGGVAATEVTRADLPDQIAAVQPVPGRDGSLTSVVREAPSQRTGIERLDRVGRERAKNSWPKC